jgi:hypothetical protein
MALQKWCERILLGRGIFLWYSLKMKLFGVWGLVFIVYGLLFIVCGIS